MSRWNHFAKRKYVEIKFRDLPIGSLFRTDSFVGKRRRKDIICIKTGPLSYMEKKSKKEFNLFGDGITVCSFDKLAEL